MNLMPFADLLETAELGVKAQTIFINMIPAECKRGILLRNKLEGTKIDYELPGYYKAPFQLIVRAGSYADGDQLISDVIDELSVTEQQVGAMYVRYARPRTKPVVFPLSKGNLLEFSVEFDVVFNE